MHDQKLKEKMKMVVKGISMDDFTDNYDGIWSNNYMSEEPMNCFRRFSNTFASEGSPILLPKFGSDFSRIKSVCFQNCDFTRIRLRHM